MEQKGIFNNNKQQGKRNKEGKTSILESTSETMIHDRAIQPELNDEEIGNKRLSSSSEEHDVVDTSGEETTDLIQQIDNNLSILAGKERRRASREDHYYDQEPIPGSSRDYREDSRRRSVERTPEEIARE